MEGVPIELLTHRFQNLMSRPRADVGGQQYILQFGEQLGIDLLLARDEVFDPATICDPRLRDRLFSGRSSSDGSLFFSSFLKMENIFLPRSRALGPFILAERAFDSAWRSGLPNMGAMQTLRRLLHGLQCFPC